MRRCLPALTGGGAKSTSSWNLFDRLLPPDPPTLKEYKERESRVIKEQFTRSKFVEAARAGGRDKLFLASPELQAAHADGVFPDIALESILEGGGGEVTSNDLFSSARATIVTMAFQGTSQTQLVPWHNALWEALTPGVGGYASPPSAGARAHGSSSGGGVYSTTPSSLGSASPLAPVQLVNILYLQGWFWRMAKGMVAGGTRRALPPEVCQATYLCLQPSARESDHFADRMRVHNRVMGHIALVDSKGFVRWRAHGMPGEGEVEALLEATANLAGGGGGGRGGGGGGGGGRGIRPPGPIF